jgi:hypothetical protein
MTSWRIDLPPPARSSTWRNEARPPSERCNISEARDYLSNAEREARLLRAAIGREGPVQPTEEDWYEWLGIAGANRVLPLLHDVTMTAAGTLSDDRINASTERQMDVMGMSVRFEHHLLVIARRLHAEQIRFAVVKGAATAHLDYADPSLRQFGDIDLLVDPDDFIATLAILQDAGWTQAYPLPRHHERFTHAITVRNGRRVEFDIHQRLGHRAIGALIPTGELLAEAIDLSIAEVSLHALSAIDRTIHAALHTITSRGEYRRLSSVADVLVLAERHAASAALVLERAEGWRLRALVERAIQDSFAAAMLPVPSEWLVAMRHPTRRRDRLVERAYLSTRRRLIAEEAAHLRVMKSWRDRCRYVFGYLTTDENYARKHGRSGLTAQLRYLWSRVHSRRST